MISPTYKIVRAMLERGNKPGIIRELLETSLKWAENNQGQDAEALRTWLAYVNFKRPFYTAAELARFWPALKLAMGLESRMTEAPSPNRLANELKFHGLPVVVRVEHTDEGFAYSASTEYFICEQVHKWRGVPLTTQEFEEILKC